MIKIKVKNILDNRNKSMYWLAKNTNLSYTAIYKLANGNTEGIQFYTLEEIMQALDITSFDEILEIIPEKEK